MCRRWRLHVKAIEREGLQHLSTTSLKPLREDKV